MKQRLLNYLACPACGGTLELTIGQQEEEEIREGMLQCTCGNTFDITRSIPRMATSLSGLKQKTSKSFGFEWNRFHKIFDAYKINFLNYIEPIKEDFFKNKVVLDAGCGVGRHSYWAAKFGAREVIGIDFSDAVDASYENTRHLPNVHIIQADIYHLPFKKEIFDFAFSIGVLHHLPDPEKGFRALVPFVKQNGTLAIWVYGKKHNISNVYIYETIRRITRHIPYRFLYYFCYIPAMGVEIINRLYRVLQKTLFKPLAAFLPFKYYSLFPFEVKLNDAFDVFATPKSTYWLKEQIEEWYRNADFQKFSVSYLRKKSLKAYGIKLI